MSLKTSCYLLRPLVQVAFPLLDGGIPNLVVADGRMVDEVLREAASGIRVPTR